MSADCGVPVVTTLVCFLLSHARLRVRAAHPAFPAPSFIEGHCLAKLGRIGAARLRIYVPGCLKIESVTPTPSSPGLTGRSSIPEHQRLIREAAAYWIPRLRGV